MSSEKPDIFDRIMAWGVLKPLQPFYQKHKEPLLYQFFGGLACLLSIISFWKTGDGNAKIEEIGPRKRV